MEAQTLINLAFTAAGVLAGWTLNRLWVSVDHLTNQDIKLADKVQSIEVLVAGRYVQRVELVDMEHRLALKLDQIWNKLDGKADK